MINWSNFKRILTPVQDPELIDIVKYWEQSSYNVIIVQKKIKERKFLPVTEFTKWPYSLHFLKVFINYSQGLDVLSAELINAIFQKVVSFINHLPCECSSRFGSQTIFHWTNSLGCLCSLAADTFLMYLLLPTFLDFVIQKSEKSGKFSTWCLRPTDILFLFLFLNMLKMNAVRWIVSLVKTNILFNGLILGGSFLGRLLHLF